MDGYGLSDTQKKSSNRYKAALNNEFRGNLELGVALLESAIKQKQDTAILDFRETIDDSLNSNKTHIREAVIKLFQNKKILIIFFIIFAFGWNPKTAMTGDIATNSLYKIIYNTSKKVFNFKGLRLFQDSPIIKFHREYIE